jgi:hypothetical protein
MQHPVVMFFPLHFLLLLLLLLAVSLLFGFACLSVLFLCVFLCLCFCLIDALIVSKFVFLSPDQSIYLSVFLSIIRTINLSVFRFVCLSVSIDNNTRWVTRALWSQFSNRLRMFLGGKQGEELSQFDQPQSVALTSDQDSGQLLLLVADCMNGRVCVWSALDRQPIREMGKGILSMPLDVAVSHRAPRTCVIVADRGQHCVAVFDLASGRFLHRFGAGLPGPRLDPISVSVSPLDLVCVADKDGHRVHVFELDGTHVRSVGVGVAGTGLGQFTSPRGIAVTGNGEIVVSEESRLQVIDTMTGAHVRFLGSKTPEFSGGRKLMCLNDEEVWVADASSTLGTIWVFAISDGRLLNKVGGFLKGPVASAMSPTTGDVFVCESGVNRISVLY